MTESPTPTNRILNSSFRWLLLFACWVLVTTIGDAVGTAVGYSFTGDQSDISWIFTLPVTFIVSGLLVGTGQWATMLLKQRISVRWIPATVIGMLFGWPIGYFVIGLMLINAFKAILGEKQVDAWIYRNYDLYTIFAMAVGGAIIGLGQWFVLRSKGKTLGWWIPISILAWSSGYEVAGWAVLQSEVEAFRSIIEVLYCRIPEFSGCSDAVFGLVYGLIEGVIAGGITGLAIIVLLMYRARPSHLRTVFQDS